MLDKENNIGGYCLRYKIIQYKNQGSLGALNDISDCVTLLQLMDSIFSVNSSVSIVGK